MLTDPISLAELAVIVACGVFFAWWYSPAQRSIRRRRAARGRTDLRRALTGPVDSAGERVPAESTR